MKKVSALILFIMFSLSLFAQDLYKVEYRYSEKPEANVKTFTLSRSGDNIKIKGKNSTGADVTMYILKGEGNIYTLIEDTKSKIGTKYKGLDCNYVGMQWGIYILDLPQCEFILQQGIAEDDAIIAGKETRKYNIARQGDVRTDLWIYNSKLMLKRDAPTTVIEATSFNESPTFTADEFVPPAGISWLED